MQIVGSCKCCFWQYIQLRLSCLLAVRQTLKWLFSYLLLVPLNTIPFTVFVAAFEIRLRWKERRERFGNRETKRTTRLQNCSLVCPSAEGKKQRRKGESFLYHLVKNRVREQNFFFHALHNYIYKISIHTLTKWQLRCIRKGVKAVS